MSLIHIRNSNKIQRIYKSQPIHHLALVLAYHSNSSTNSFITVPSTFSVQTPIEGIRVK